MQRYFFNVHNLAPSPDLIGELLEDDEAAWKEATITAGQIFKDLDGDLRPGQEWSLEVTNEQRQSLYLIAISTKRKH